MSYGYEEAASEAEMAAQAEHEAAQDAQGRAEAEMIQEQHQSEINEIIYKMACDFGFIEYSTPKKIDYKFWEDIEAETIAGYLAEKILIEKDKIKNAPSVAQAV